MSKKEVVGYCPVDSGQIIIVDPCYLSAWTDGDYAGADGKNDSHYAKACEITLTKQGAGEMLVSGVAGNAVVSATHSGDGLYPVFADRDEDGRIKSLTIQFEP